MSERIVTRFAPSPTGYLHVGGARTALFNWAFARRHSRKGTFILRIEDTDRARSTPEATRRIVEDLRWLGIDWDQGPDPDDIGKSKGPHGPYFQSQRGEIYRQYLQKLIDLGRAYPDSGGDSGGNSEGGASGGGAYRFRMPESSVTVHDLVLGDVTIQREQLEDFIIMKGEAAGGGPTFHFANVIDDATMGVTHVLRAQEHLMNTPKHVALFDALGIERPKYAHMPLIFNPDGSKMSKRDKAKIARQAAKTHGLQAAAVANIDPASLTLFLDKKSDDVRIAEQIAAILDLSLPEIDVHDFRASGYLPGVLLNYLALLGWNPGGDVEKFDLDFLCRNFDIERIGKSNAKFDRAKLLSFNADALASQTPEVFFELLRRHLAEFHPDFLVKFSEPALRLFAEAYRPRSRTLDDPVIAGQFFVVRDDEIAHDAKAVEKVLKKDNSSGWAALAELEREMAALESWEPAAIHGCIEQLAQRTDRKMGDLAQPLRVAVTGTAVSPAIHDTLAILGKDSTLARMRRCLEVVGK